MSSLMRPAMAMRVVPMAVFMLLLAGRDVLVLGHRCKARCPAWAWTGVGCTACRPQPQGARPLGGGATTESSCGNSWPTAMEALQAIGVGLLVLVAWINLDAPWMLLGDATPGVRAHRRSGYHGLAVWW